MTDIVEQLRAMPSSFNDALRTMEQAADEITRLQSEIHLLEERVEKDWHLIGSLEGEIDKLRQRND